VTSQQSVRVCSAFLQDAVVIGARFDVDSGGDSCRLAFYGRLQAGLGAGGPADLRQLQVYKVSEGCSRWPCPAVEVDMAQLLGLSRGACSWW